MGSIMCSTEFTTTLVLPRSSHLRTSDPTPAMRIVWPRPKEDSPQKKAERLLSDLSMRSAPTSISPTSSTPTQRRDRPRRSRLGGARSLVPAEEGTPLAGDATKNNSANSSKLTELTEPLGRHRLRRSSRWYMGRHAALEHRHDASLRRASAIWEESTASQTSSAIGSSASKGLGRWTCSPGLSSPWQPARLLRSPPSRATWRHRWHGMPRRKSAPRSSGVIGQRLSCWSGTRPISPSARLARLGRVNEAFRRRQSAPRPGP